MTLPCSSGSSCVESALDPTMSQNMIVSCRRSAKDAVGVGEAEEATVGSAGEDAPLVRLEPHLAQNLAFAELVCPQAEHGRGSAVPHSSQKLLSSGTWALQLGH